MGAQAMSSLPPLLSIEPGRVGVGVGVGVDRCSVPPIFGTLCVGVGVCQVLIVATGGELNKLKIILGFFFLHWMRLQLGLLGAVSARLRIGIGRCRFQV